MHFLCVCSRDKLLRAGSKLTSYWQSRNNSTKLSWRGRKSSKLAAEYLQSRQLFQQSARAGEEKSPLSVCCMHAGVCDAGNSQIELTFLENGKYIAPGSMHLGGGSCTIPTDAFLPTSGIFFSHIAENKTCLAGCKRKVVVWAVAATASEGALDKWIRAAEIKTLPSMSSDRKCI
jgi:hypothetical protein